MATKKPAPVVKKPAPKPVAKAVAKPRGAQTPPPAPDYAGDVRKDYGYGAWVLTDPEMVLPNGENVFAYALAQGITDKNRLNELIAQTKWYTSRTPTERVFDIAHNDTLTQGALNEAIANTQRELLTWAQKEGTPLSADQAQKIAYDANREGFAGASDEEKTRRQARVMEATKPTAATTGDLGAMVTDYKALARQQFFLPLPDAVAEDWARQTVAGKTSRDGFIQYLSGEAAKRFSPWAKDIQSGYTPAQMATNLTSLVHDQLDVSNPDYVNDPFFAKLLNFSPDPKDPISRPMDYGEALNYVRSSDRFKQSTKGQAARAQIGNVIDSMMREPV